MTKFPARPVGEYGPNGDGLGDPERLSVSDRQRISPGRLAEERRDAATLSPTIKRLRAAARKALGGAS